ncbi:MAG TPA: COX15/CtaA family protein [Solirubrobacteraceae bacterium]|jgi:cytochrome c oxidase assembly protein subunit 15|nr:COX15/CtaA family protein [Solirubrobacteraceae bacterium]
MWSRVPRIGPEAYARVAAAALAILAVIVFTGAAVRLTGSGLGCPTWPKCHGHFVTTELSSHGWIEYGNRLVTGVVSVLAILAALGAFLRRPFRRDLAILGLLLPLGVIVQIGLGGLSVLYGLAPGWVMAHFATSQAILAAAVALAWRARSEPGAMPSQPRRLVLAVRTLLPLAAWVLFVGTVATAAGPHPGASGDEVVTRLDFHGGNTLDWVVHWHGHFAELLGVVAVAVWLYAWRLRAPWTLRAPLTTVCCLLAAQGVVGFVQYDNRLPAGLVWVHVVLATCTWLSVLWSVAAAGRLQVSPREASQSSTTPSASRLLDSHISP